MNRFGKKVFEGGFKVVSRLYEKPNPKRHSELAKQWWKTYPEGHPEFDSESSLLNWNRKCKESFELIKSIILLHLMGSSLKGMGSLAKSQNL